MLVPVCGALVPTLLINTANMRQMKDMEPSVYRRDQIGSVAISQSVPALVVELQTELRSLMTRKKEIRWRINNIRSIMRGLQEMVTSPPLGDVRAEPSSLPGVRPLAVRPGGDGVADSPRHPNPPRDSLQRACRIALLESETPASLEDIYTRVVRRGSISFASSQRARKILLRVLNVMCQDGEVRLFKTGQGPRWQRISPASQDHAGARANVSTSVLPPASDMQVGMRYPGQEPQPANELG